MHEPYEFKTCPNFCKQHEKHEWTYGYRALVNSEDVVQVYFPTKEIAQKVCDILNEELKQNSAH